MATGSPDPARPPRRTPSHPPSAGPRGGFRLRLALLIATIFSLCGGLLLLSQYLITAGLLDKEVRQVSVGDTAGSSGEPTSTGTATAGAGATPWRPCPSDTITAAPSTTPGAAAPGGVDCVSGSDAMTGASGGLGLARQLRDNVLAGSLTWLVGLIALFGLVSAALAWWLAGRSLRRIREVTAIATSVSERDLSQRLNLPGPRDEIKELGDTFDAMLTRLERSFAAQERFIANASHELRTPLAAGRTALEAPLAQGLFPAEVEPSVRRSLAANQRSSELISSLLELAKSRSGEPLSVDRVDLSQLVAGRLEAYAPAAAQRRLSLHSELGAARVDADPMLMSQAVDNLVGNAIRHTPSGGEVWLRTSAATGTATFLISNTGADLTPGEADQLVEPFHRGGASRIAGTSGHGLGLAIVSSIVDEHHGSLRLTPRARGGLTVSMQLPTA